MSEASISTMSISNVTSSTSYRPDVVLSFQIIGPIEDDPVERRALSNSYVDENGFTLYVSTNTPCELPSH